MLAARWRAGGATVASFGDQLLTLLQDKWPAMELAGLDGAAAAELVAQGWAVVEPALRAEEVGPLVRAMADCCAQLGSAAVFPGLWPEVVRRGAVPPAFREAVLAGVHRALQASAASHTPTDARADADAILDAERLALRWFAEALETAPLLESLPPFAAAWLTAVDEAAAVYWKGWGLFVAGFARDEELAVATGAQLCQCLATLEADHFAQFEASAAAAADKVAAAPCTRLVEALGDAPPPRRRGPAGRAALAELLTQATAVRITCCVYPVRRALQPYAELACWTQEGDDSPSGSRGRGEPTEAITAVGETLFALVAQLDDAFLPKVLAAVSSEVAQACLRVPSLAGPGAAQMAADVAYCMKVLDALAPDQDGETLSPRVHGDLPAIVRVLQGQEVLAVHGALERKLRAAMA